MSKVKFRSGGKTSRELRRMAEREQTREQRQRALEAFWKLPPEERAQRYADNEAFKRISRNGITLEDMKQAEDKALADGYNAGKEEAVRLCYAAICLALKEQHGFGIKRCKAVLNAVDEKITYALTSDELAREVLQEIGLEIRFSDALPGDRIQEVWT